MRRAFLDGDHGSKRVFGSRGQRGTRRGRVTSIEEVKARDDPRLYFNRLASPLQFLKGFRLTRLTLHRDAHVLPRRADSRYVA